MTVDKFKEIPESEFVVGRSSREGKEVRETHQVEKPRLREIMVRYNEEVYVATNQSER